MSLSIEEDAVTLLRSAAQSEGISESAMAERAIRQTCTAYAPHQIDVDVLSGGRFAVSVVRNGRVIYSRRALQRGEAAEVEGTVIVDVVGKVAPQTLSREVRGLRMPAGWMAHTSAPAVWDGQNRRFVLENLPLAVDQPAALSLLGRAADVLGALRVTSLHDVMKVRCPQCDLPMESIFEWAPVGKAETREFTCMIGHVTET